MCEVRGHCKQVGLWMPDGVAPLRFEQRQIELLHEILGVVRVGNVALEKTCQLGSLGDRGAQQLLPVRQVHALTLRTLARGKVSSCSRLRIFRSSVTRSS